MTREDGTGSVLAVFFHEFADPFLRLLLFAALLSGIVGVVRGDLSEAGGIVLTTLLTALAATANRLRINRHLTGPERERSRVREFARQARGGLIVRLERLVAIIGISAAGIAAATLLFLVVRSVRSGLAGVSSHEWLFVGIAGLGAFLFAARLWLYLLYQASAVIGLEIDPEGVFAADALRSWSLDLKAGLLGILGPLAFGVLSGLLPADPRQWLSWTLFLEVQRILLIIISIVVITVPDGLGMSVALALRLGINRLRARGVMVRDPHLCEWFGTVTVVLVDQELLVRIPAAEFERTRRVLRRMGVEMRPVFTAAGSLGLLEEVPPADDGVSQPKRSVPRRRLVHPSRGPGGTRLELPYLPELDGFVVDCLEEDLPALVAELEISGETVAWLRPVAGQPETVELAAFNDQELGRGQVVEPVSLARFDAPGLGRIPEILREGVEIEAGIRRFLVFQLPVNLAGMLFELSGLILGWQLPLSLTQVLWINLVMDVVAPWMLAGEPLQRIDNGESRRGRAPRMLVNEGMLEEILWTGLAMFLLAMGFLMMLADGAAVSATPGVGPSGLRQSGAAFFALFLSMQCWNLLLARFFGTEGSLTRQALPGLRFSGGLAFLFLLTIGVVQFGGEILQTAPLPFKTWAAVLVLPALIVVSAELRRRGILPGGR